MMPGKFGFNTRKMYALKFLISLSFSGSVLVPFYTDWGGLNFVQMMLLQSWFMFWIFIFEVPSGTFADKFGRKFSMAISCAIVSIAAIIYGSIPNFYVFMFGEFLWALSIALMSGASDAFVYDNLKRTNHADKSKKVFGRMESFSLVGYMVAAPVGGIMASQLGLNYPMLLTSVPLVAAFLIALTLNEPKFVRGVKSRHYLETLKGGIKFLAGSNALKVLALDMIVISTIVYFIFWLYQPVLKQSGVGIVYFGVVGAAMAAGQIFVMNGYGRLEKLLGSKKNLLFLTALVPGVMFLSMGLTTYVPLVVSAIILGSGLGMSRGPLFSSYMNKHIPSVQRATILSTVNMFSRIVLVFANPLIGMMMDWSLNYTLVILGVSAVAFAFLSKVEESHLID